MADTSIQEQLAESMAQHPHPHTNGLDGVCPTDEDERSKIRPADIDADMREMERRKRVELIMNSRLFREELERIIETQMKDGGSGTGGLLQQLQDMMGIPKHANVFKGSNCVIPINDIRGVESMGYAKGEKLLRCKLAAVYRLMDLHGWAQGVGNQITARLNQDQEHFIVNPYGMLCHEITASSLVKIDMQGNVVEQGTTNFGVNVAAFSLHAAIHAARPDVKCAIHVHTPAVLAVSALKCGLLPVSQESVVIGEVSSHPYAGGLAEPEEREKVARNLGPINKVLLLANHGAVCCGETVEEAFFNVYNTIVACETQLKLMPIGIDNLALVSEETRKQMYEAARRAPDGTTSGAPRPMAAEPGSVLADKLAERKWRIGGVEFEALMRMLDNAGFRTGYIYRHPLIKGDPPRPRNDVEVPPAVSSLGYLLEEEEMYKQGIWKAGRKGNDRTRWLNSPNVYQKVEILETGTPDPKKITKWVDANADEWVADGSPTHSSTPMKIDVALQFVPKNTNPKEFKLLQQQIKDNRRADKISAGPQSHILEGVSWEEAKKMQDAGVTQTGDQVVVVGAASKGIIQRGYQHNAMVYKAPYAKNPFDSVTDEELDEYKKVIEKKAKGEYDTDYSESESAQISKRVDHLRSPTSADETEEESRDEPRVLRIETKQAPKPSQPEVVLSDDDEYDLINANANANVNANIQLLNAERIDALQTHQQSSSTIKTYLNKGYGCITKMVLRVPKYRSNSHYGMPQGSYMVPQPQHYHHIKCCKYKYIQHQLIQQPIYIKYTTNNNQQFHHFNCNDDPKFTINITNIQNPLTIDIPINIVKQFIEPIYKIININKNKNNNNNTLLSSSSTSSTLTDYQYNNNNKTIIPINHNTFNIENNNDTSMDESISEFTDTDTDTNDEEYQILRKQRDNLMNDIQQNINLLDLDTSFSDIEILPLNDEYDHIITNTNTNTNDTTISGKIENFARKIHNCQFSVNNNNNNIIFESLNDTDEYKSAQDLTIDDNDDDDDHLRLNENEVENENTILKSILDISKNYDDHEYFAKTIDVLNENGKYIWPDHNCATAVKLISKQIYKYVIKSCIETIENLEFPEIRCYHDAEPLFDALVSVFDQFADCFPSENDLNQLKKSILVNIAKNIEHHFLIIPLTGEHAVNKTIEQHKFTTLHKFISLLIYILFDKIENPEFQCTHYELPDLSDFSIQFHSTPEQIEHCSETIDNNSESESITTFLKQKSEKTGSLQYWFMINDKVMKQPKRSSSSSLFFHNNNNKPINISPQRLRRSSAPARFISDAPKILSPIPEEPRRNIFIDFQAQAQQLNATRCLSPENKQSSDANTTPKNFYEICYNFNVQSDDYETYSVKTPVKRQNGRILFMKEVTFIPKKEQTTTTTTTQTTKITNSITFIPKNNIDSSDDFTSNTYKSSNSFNNDDDDDQDDDNDNDWMGYESAKF